MRVAKLLLTTAALGLATVCVAAQDAEAPPPEESRGLSDLEATVNELLEEETNPISPPPAEPDAGPVEETREPEAPLPEASEPAETETPPTEVGEPEAQATEPAETETPPAEAAPAPPAPPAPPLTRAEIATVERTATRGRLLVAIARAGMLATQDMLTRLSDPEGAGIVGWIAEPQGNAMDVSFYAADEDGPRTVYRATVNGGRIVSREIFLGDDRPVLNRIQARMAAARAATEGLEHAACTDQPFNVLVVPPASVDGPIDVYQISAPARRGAFPLGGHFRSTVAPDGTVAETRGFTNSCVEVELPPSIPGQPSRPVGITHLLDPMPTEVHVLLSQLMGRPLLVATGDPQRVWLVTGDRIAEVRP